MLQGEGRVVCLLYSEQAIQTAVNKTIKIKIFSRRVISGSSRIGCLREITFYLSGGSAEHLPFNSNLTRIRVYFKEMADLETPLIGEKK